MRVIYFAGSTARLGATARLTQREAEVLRLMAEGQSDHEIAAALGVKAVTVRSHVSSALYKLGASSRTEASATAHAGEHRLSRTPADPARAFRQLELLIKYALLVTPPTKADLSPLWSSLYEKYVAPREEASLLEMLEDVPGEEMPPAAPAESKRPDRGLVPAVLEGLPYERSVRGPSVSVISIRMESPLQVVLEIPAVLWAGMAIGLLALAERITTTSVRIARKRKEELLKIAILDKQTELVRAGRADVLAQLLLEHGPQRTARGPDEIAFVDPNDPEDELETA